ncbi:MAG TPA: nucleoside phosphorylase [Pelolinea sp.]|nr:nucleoside phosphorylase [Pelolinea sp.]
MSHQEHSKKESSIQLNPSPYRLTPFTKADLPIDDEGWIYHLQIKPEDIAPDILIVGDPGRAEMIGSTFLREIELQNEHRGLVTITGTSEITREQTTIISPLRTTVTTSGMGTPSLEIILQELVALNEIDFETRLPKTSFPKLQIIRVGTSGALQKSTKLGIPIITSYSIGLDNSGLFYEASYPDDVCERLEKELGQLMLRSMKKDSRFYGKIHPYVSRANPVITSALSEASVLLGIESKVGLTVSCSGFFAAQGRDIARIEPSIPDLDEILSAYDPGIDGQKIENMEMESSFLNHFLGGLGYLGGAICTAIANRRKNTFDNNNQESMNNTIKVALLALAINRSRIQADKE